MPLKFEKICFLCLMRENIKKGRKQKQANNNNNNIEKTVEHAGDNYTNCNWCVGNGN